PRQRSNDAISRSTSPNSPLNAMTGRPHAISASCGASRASSFPSTKSIKNCRPASANSRSVLTVHHLSGFRTPLLPLLLLIQELDFDVLEVDLGRLDLECDPASAGWPGRSRLLGICIPDVDPAVDDLAIEDMRGGIPPRDD